MLSDKNRRKNEVRRLHNDMVHRGVARILGKRVLMYACANFDHAHLQNGKVEVQTITENAF